MDEMLRYIFKNMQNYDQEFLATARGFIAVKKCFKAQNKVNNLVTLSLCLFLVMHAIAYSDIKNLYERVVALEKEKIRIKGNKDLYV